MVTKTLPGGLTVQVSERRFERRRQLVDQISHVCTVRGGHERCSGTVAFPSFRPPYDPRKIDCCCWCHEETS